MSNEAQCRNLASATSLRAVVAALALVIMLMLGNSAAAQGSQWMHLLSPGVGWVASGSSLFWTTDNGKQWKNITPPLQDKGMVSAFFLDTSTGWVLLAGSGDEEPGAKFPAEPKFDLASTNDSGATWSLTHLRVPVEPSEYTLVSQGDILFTDASHGWMNLDVQSSSNFHSGLLFRTLDGGKNWAWSPGAGAGRLRFIDRQNGWIVSPEGNELGVTHDGGKTWAQVSLTAPLQVRPAETVVYQLPVFADDKHGALAVSFSASPNDRDATAKGSRVALFVTADGGRVWEFDRVLSQRHSWHATLEPAVADSTLITAEEGSDDVLTLKQISLEAGGSLTVANASVGHNGGVDSVSFVNAQQGWVLTFGSHCSPGDTNPDCMPQLLSTVDGGSSWANIAPWKPKRNAPPHARRLKVTALSQLASVSPHLRLGVGYEFLERQDGYKGLVSTYGLNFAEAPRVMDLGLLYRALQNQSVDVVAGNNTDGLIAALGFVVLDDDKHYFPPYDAVPIVRPQVLQACPHARAAFGQLGGRITAEDMRRMNYAVDGEKRDAAEVVREFFHHRNLQA